MKKVYIWGVGKYAGQAYEALKKDKSAVAGFIDKDENKQKEKWRGTVPIYAPEHLKSETYDYIFISAQNFKPVESECSGMGIDGKKVISLFHLKPGYDFIDYNVKRIMDLEIELEDYKLRLENAPYEWGIKETLHVKSSEELLSYLINKRASLCRFGDGELELMRGKERLWYQNTNSKLAERLSEVLHSNQPEIAIAVADNFGSLEHYTDQAALRIRQYLSKGTREEIMSMIDTSGIYYDAYVSRPYIIYKKKEKAKVIFSLLKKLWSGRSLLIVEGSYSRMGVNNDLLSAADSVRRILCPPENAFDKYEKILNNVKKEASKNDLVLISLGPTATVLAFDLANSGIQAIDIGQLDNEYEWYLRNTEERVDIAGKVVAELGWCHRPESVVSSQYQREICSVIN